MQMIENLRELPVMLASDWNDAKEFVLSIPSRVSSAVSGIFHNERVEQWIKPWFDRHIKPLEKGDYLLMITVVAIAALALGCALLKFGVAALPLGLGAAGLIIGLCGFYLHKKVQQHFDDIAWEHLDQIRRSAHDITDKNQDFQEVVKERAALEKPEFQHLKDDLKNLDEETRRFRKDATAPHYDNKRDFVKVHIALLLPKVQANPQDKTLLEALQKEVDNIGTDKQDLVALETAKQKLKDLQTPQALADLAELSQQINDLANAAQGPDFENTKKAYLEYLKGLQNKLSRKDVEDLP